MASIWDRIKGFFGTAPAGDPATSAIEKAMIARARRRESFTALDIAQEVTADLPQRTAQDLVNARNTVDALFHQRLLEPYGYHRAWQGGTGNYLYNPYGPGSSAGPVAAPAPPVAPPSPPRAPVSPAAPSPHPPRPPGKNPYAVSEELLGLSAEALRQRALLINPYQTAWIGRTDTIPPQGDERTALIDRGLLLRGLLTEKQLADIHAVGDLWLKHREAAQLAEVLAAQGVADALEARRLERAARKEQKRKESAERARLRAEAVARRKAEDIIFLGRGVSGGLGDRRSNLEGLQERGLPVLSAPADVAVALGLPVPQLRWLCFHTEAAERTHYVYFEVEKRSGGKRLLAAPHRKLGQAQEWILRNILDLLPTESPAHGFIRGRSTVSNARAHVGRDVVVTLDLSDFFPTITFARVRGVFQKLGYSPAVATVLALLCTEAPRREVEYDGKRYWVAVGERALPQGACTSPALSNQVARRLDRRLRGRFAAIGWEYTRYADDLTFSAAPGQRADLPWLHAIVRHVVEEEGFSVNPKKGRIQSSGSRQSVTGIVVNQKLSVPRDEVRRLRAILHGARKTGLAAQNREGRPHFEAWLQGKIAYLCMVDREKGLRLLRELEALTASGGSPPG